MLKEFIISNPPTFNISDRCCYGAKKDTAKMIDSLYDCKLKIIGERRSEGGVRALAHSSCFEYSEKNKTQTYRPLFFWTDEDKKQYEEVYGIKHSDCYQVWGMKRTGCAGCPFGSRFEDELDIIQ